MQGGGGEEPRWRADETGMFAEHISWKSKVALLRLAKQHAWRHGATRLSRHLFRWEKAVGLR